ncbi:MAG: hypothetical protein A2Y10_00715 [Planctomycetes bacterium GWF2_41_51]|nr:MAG: hypothetical protein A2Y10_00715 [Planctomycetes bacterium GWF2_41_51]HBG25912.1 hypothetical protein [Phycisphaerales bacterium]
MKKTQFVLVTALLVLCSTVLADRQLERAEMLQIFEQLTSQPVKTWIPAGTINANHQEFKASKTNSSAEITNKIKEEIGKYQNNVNKLELTEETQKMKFDAIPFNVRYKLSNEFTMNSSEVVKYDGERFYWEINTESRTDSVKPGKELAGNFMTDQFDLNSNAKRIFVWDGEKYINYFLPSNQATVDWTGQTPHVVNGPLTAGIIPWGYGFYTYEKLSSAQSSAVEKFEDGRPQIHLTVDYSEGSQMLFVLDPQKNYAVLSNVIKKLGNLTASKQYSDFQLVSGRWVPSAILIEKYEASSGRLLARDIWEITGINVDVPSAFKVDYNPEALVENFVFDRRKSEIYRHSPAADTDLLLADRIEYAANEGTRKQNCATAALKYASAKLGKNVTDAQLAELVSDANGQTNLYAMKNFAQGQGLYCRAVRTNIETLKNLSGCKAILYIPGKKHFVVLDSIDDKDVWTVDLSNGNFYYQTDLNFIDMDWSDGTVLLLSNQPISGDFTEIAGSELQNINGLGYECTKLLQEYHVLLCEQLGTECLGTYIVFWTRYGCQIGEGSCATTWMIRYSETDCIQDCYFPEACTVTGTWTNYTMRACGPID